MKKKNKARWISRLLTLYHFFSGKLQKNTPLNAEMEFERIAIYSTTALGDLMFNTPAIVALKQRYPNASFVLVSSEKNRPLVETSDWFTDVFYWDNKIRNARGVISSLKRFRPQLTVILHSYMPYDILCAVLSGTEYIIRDNYRVDGTLLNGWLNRVPPVFEGHLIQRKLNLLTPLGCRNDNTAMRIPVSYTPGTKGKTKRIGFQMGASEAKRCWPVERFTQLAALLIAQHCEIVLIGGPKDHPLAEEFRKLTDTSLLNHVEFAIGKTSLLQLLTVIDGLDVLVTGDTGPLHLAIALQTPTVSLYASAEPAYTGPCQDLTKHIILKLQEIPENEKQPLHQISAQQVCRSVMTLLKEDEQR